MSSDNNSPVEPTKGRTLLPALILGWITPADALSELVGVLHSTDEPDADLCLDVGCGDLESLLRHHETALWSEVERLARNDVRFRRALRSVWADDSPEYDRRMALLAELGEHAEITVRFTIMPDDFADDPPLSWRAFSSDGDIGPHRLAEILRSVAGWLDRPDTADRQLPGPPRGLRLTAPGLAELLDDAPPDVVGQAVRVACQRAVEASGLASPDAETALAYLAGEHLGAGALQQLVDRLRASASLARDQAFLTFGGPPESQDERASRQGLAAEALAYALDRHVPDFAARAIFCAGFATRNRAELWADLATHQFEHE